MTDLRLRTTGTTRSEGIRLGRARRRAARAKLTLGVAGAVAFGLSMALARLHYPGHAKGPARSLAAPPRFERAVRENLLQAGIVAPVQAPPDASTSLS